MIRVLFIEDDQGLSSSLKKYLSEYDIDLTIAPNLAEAYKLIKGGFDCFLVDWNLPDGQGPDFISKAKASLRQTPIVMVTAKTDLVDKVLCLEAGAIDYVTKPFEPRELVARIRAHCRPGKTTEKSIEISGLQINFESREVKYLGSPLVLTKLEFELLSFLAKEPGKVFSRDEILNRVWGFDNFPTTRTVDTHILQLRQKTSDQLFESIRGIGYRIRTDEKLTKP